MIEWILWILDYGRCYIILVRDIVIDMGVFIRELGFNILAVLLKGIMIVFLLGGMKVRLCDSLYILSKNVSVFWNNRSLEIWG